MALQGFNALIKLQSSAVVFTGEATTMSGTNTIYTITDTDKNIWDLNTTVDVFVFDADDAAEAGTTATNITMDTHGLSAGDLIINTTRSSAKRVVTVVVDADNVTVASVTDQASTDTIKKYNKQSASDTTKTFLEGKVTFDSAVARTVLVSGAYVTPATVATGKSFSFSGTSDALENTPFGSEYREYQAGLVTGTGEISRFFVADDLFIDDLLSGSIKIVELYPDSSGDPIQFYGIITSETIEAPVDGLIEESISFQITKEMGI